MSKEITQLIQQIKPWESWIKAYNNYVPKFIEEAATGKIWKEWDKDVFNEFFERGNEQCVASLKQGYFTNKEKEHIKEHWQELAPFLQRLAQSQVKPNFELYNETYQTLLNLAKAVDGSNRRAASYRIIASLQPELLSTIVTEKSIDKVYKLIKKQDLNLNNVQEDIPDDYFGKNYFLAQFSKQYVHLLSFKDSNIKNLEHNYISIPWQLLESIDINESDKTESSDEIEVPYHSSLNEILSILKTKQQIILQGPPGTGKTYLAKKIANAIITEEHNPQEEDLSKAKESQIKFIQFHPSYTYEDFVRGIVVTTTEEGQIEYKVENKILAEMARRANKNYQDWLKDFAELNQERNIDVKFEYFRNYLEDNINNKEALKLTDSAEIYEITDKAFKYIGISKVTGRPWYGNIFFSELKKLIKLNIRTRQEIRALKEEIKDTTHRRASYYAYTLTHYYDVIKHQKEIPSNNNLRKISKKTYILIIDEINRANLPAVLGELIYALEYRNEPVESLYEHEEEGREIILPPNLYIIGTMNTADRSVEEIDYAIRRRFAFYPVLPRVLTEEELNNENKPKELKKFAPNLFEKVSTLFTGKDNHLNPEFEADDVQIGQSYFIYKSEKELKNKLEYEIKPLLKEYVKDGILYETALEIIDNLTIEEIK